MSQDQVAALQAEVARLRRRIDRHDAERRIAHLMYRYIYACDELKDADRIAELFTEDAAWEGQGHFAEFGTTTGRSAIREMFVENPAILPMTAHFLTNPVVGVSQDLQSGWGQWHVLEAATLRDGVAQVWIAAWYDCDFAEVRGNWLISHIRYRDTFVVPYEDGWLKTTYVSPLSLTKTSRL